METPDPAASDARAWRTRLPYVAAVSLFVAATWYAVDGLEVGPEDLRPGAALLLLGVGVPVLAVLNGEEFRAMAGLLGMRRPFTEGLRVSVLGTAANILPLPGAAILRMVILRRNGAAYRDATLALLLTAAAWGATTAVVAGALVAGSGRTALGTVAAVGGALGWTAVGLVARWRLGTGLLPVVRLIGVEVASVLVGALRFLLVLATVGEPVGFEQAAALTVAGVVAAATGIFPGGIGLREVLAGLIGPLVDLPARLAVLAAVGNRIAEYVVLAPTALLLSRSGTPLTELAAHRDGAGAG